jgi:Ca2+-binding RTX toxin-like protein
MSQPMRLRFAKLTYTASAVGLCLSFGWAHGTLANGQPGGRGPGPVTTCHGKVANVVGTPRGDHISARRGDVIATLGGNDRVHINRGPVTACGGAGDDTIQTFWEDQDTGAPGVLIDGGRGQDTLGGSVFLGKIPPFPRVHAFGRGGADAISGGARHDRLNGGGGLDVIYGFSHRDSIFGGDARDVIRGGGADDTLHGGDGNDRLVGDGKASFGEPGSHDAGFGGPGTDSCHTETRHNCEAP